MFSKILRRTHMYVALFLSPWVLMYTLSTFVMNHRDWFRGNPAPPPKFEVERELAYTGEFPPDAGPKQMALQILASLELDGAHGVNNRDSKLVIQRQDLTHPRRITFTPADRKLTVERMDFEPAAFLERFHRRRGYMHDYAADDIWAFSVDFFIAATVFWVLSGLWLWWELKVTRALGAWCLAGGAAVFTLYVVVA